MKQIKLVTFTKAIVFLFRFLMFFSLVACQNNSNNIQTSNNQTNFSKSYNSTKLNDDNYSEINKPDYSNVLPILKENTKIPILLPASIPLIDKSTPIFGNIDHSSTSAYGISFDFTPDCKGASVCSFGSIYGKAVVSSTELPKGKPISLHQGIKSYYLESNAETCGAGYCFDTLTWDFMGSRYVLKIKPSAENSAELLRQIANSALKEQLNQ